MKLEDAFSPAAVQDIEREYDWLKKQVALPQTKAPDIQPQG